MNTPTVNAPAIQSVLLRRALYKTLWLAVLALCFVWSIASAVWVHRTQNTDTPQSLQTATELPTHWQGSPLRPLALDEVELRFARHFPGTVSRMTDGRQVLVLRTVMHPTRLLHPASDCYRGLGYRIQNEQLEVQADQKRWRCFLAQRGAKAVRVCERIEDAQGQGYTDTSSWYWAAITGQSHGPWQALTVATPLSNN